MNTLLAPVMTSDEYVKILGLRCPHCRSEDIQPRGDFEAGVEEVSEEVVCHQCNATWTDVYLFKHCFDKKSEKILAENNQWCPHCQASEIEAECSFQRNEDATVTQEVLCTECGKRWVDEYALEKMESR